MKIYSVFTFIFNIWVFIYMLLIYICCTHIYRILFLLFLVSVPVLIFLEQRNIKYVLGDGRGMWLWDKNDQSPNMVYHQQKNDPYSVWYPQGAAWTNSWTHPTLGYILEEGNSLWKVLWQSQSRFRVYGEQRSVERPLVEVGWGKIWNPKWTEPKNSSRIWSEM